MTYCTLFNSNYLDKAKVMIDSLAAVDNEMTIYVLCMDNKSFEILYDLNIKNCNLIGLEEFEDDELLSVKDDRSPGEYCWTCTAKLIKYVLFHFECEICTYVDSDLFFYSDPTVLIREMLEQNCSVQVISHNFPDTAKGRRQEYENGKNCVQFNTFTNKTDSLNLLDKWISQCLSECSVDSAGDQKYTSEWGSLPFVSVSSNLGAGVAPWNISRFRANTYTPLIIQDRKNRKEYDMVFYHFQNITNRDRYHVVINPLLTNWSIDKKLIKHLYFDYLKKIEKAKDLFEKDYDFLPLVCKYISDGKYSIADYMKRAIRSPIKSIPPLLIRMSLKLLKALRRKEAVIDVRTIYEKGN